MKNDTRTRRVNHSLWMPGDDWCCYTKAQSKCFHYFYVRWLGCPCFICWRTVKAYRRHSTLTTMAQHYPEIIGIVLLLIFAATMFYQGTMIMKGHRGYTHMDHEKQKMTNMRKRIEELMNQDDDWRVVYFHWLFLTYALYVCSIYVWTYYWIPSWF